MIQDIRFALRALRKSWALSLLAVVSLALAVAGNSLVFSMVDAFLLRPFPFKDADGVMIVWIEKPDEGLTQPVVSPAEVRDLRERSKSLSQIAAWGVFPRNLERGEETEQVTSAWTTADLFEMLGAVPVKGRLFQPEDGRTGAEPVTLLSYEFWEEEMGSDPDVIGQTLRLNGTQHTIIGVLEPNWEIFYPGIPFYVPMAIDSANLPRQRIVIAMARLAEGVSLEQASEEIALIGAQLAEEYPDTNRGTVASIDYLRDRVPDPSNKPLFAAIQGVLLCVLLIACVNIANLLLARGYKRQQEFALRSALGADRNRLVRLLLTESLVLATFGGLLGILLARAGLQILNAQLGAALPPHWTPALDANTLGFTIALTALAGVLFGLAPAWQGFKTDLVETLKEGGRGSALASRRSLLPRALVVAEVCLALVLLSGAAVMIRAFEHLQLGDMGFPPDKVLIGLINLPVSKYPDGARINDYLDRLVPELQAIPGVTHATVSNGMPRSPFSSERDFADEEMSAGRQEELPTASYLVIDPGHLELLGIELLQGRRLAATDREGAEPVALISRGLAERYYAGRDPVGQRIRVGQDWRRIVGIVADFEHEFIVSQSGPGPAIYVPRQQETIRNPWVMLRTSGDPNSLAAPMREAVSKLDSSIAVGQVGTLEETLNQFLSGSQVVVAILIAFGIVALALAALGLYGVLSYSVAQRSHEIGVRLALGAGRRQVLASVLKQGGMLALIGFAIGLPIIPLVTNAIQSGLQGFAPPVEWSTVAFVAVTLLLVSLTASFLPARRAASVDPLVALRLE